jgi:hypothetical protein
MKKCQYSMEFLIFFSFLCIALFIWLIIYSSLNEDAIEARHKKAMQDLGKSIQTHLFVASSARPGYYSNKLFIPNRIGSIEFSVAKPSPYIFTIKSDNQEYVFNIPYTLGDLNKSTVQMWNVCGVVCLQPCKADLNCNVMLMQCSDGKDNEGDGLIDSMDGGCYHNFVNPVYDPTWDNESDKFPPAGNYVYKYYKICQKANLSMPNLCNQLQLAWWPDGDTVTAASCDVNTNEHYCS